MSDTSGACSKDATCHEGGTVHCATYAQYGAVLDDIGDTCCVAGCAGTVPLTPDR